MLSGWKALAVQNKCFTLDFSEEDRDDHLH